MKFAIFTLFFFVSQPFLNAAEALNNHFKTSQESPWTDFPPDTVEAFSLDSYSKHVHPPHINQDVWETLKPYFLPEIHPIKQALDTIFSANRVLASKKSMKRAGFDVLKHPQRAMVIARHPSLKGYLIKAYLDNKKVNEYDWWKKRINGVRQIQECIDRHGINALMKTPKKWIYPLPEEPAPKDSPATYRKDFILIVEDMNILNRKKNLMAYRNQMTPDLLEAIYIVLTENFLNDSIFAPNIPFSHDGKIAVLDTEHFNHTGSPMKLWKLARYLSPEMHIYWDRLIEQYEFQAPL